MYHVYILKCSDGSLYTGITTDVERRFKEHKNRKGGSYTASHRPTKIVYTESAGSRGDALRREAEIKSWPRNKKINLIKGKINL